MSHTGIVPEQHDSEDREVPSTLHPLASRTGCSALGNEKHGLGSMAARAVAEYRLLTMAGPLRIFLSYASSDQKAASDLASRLRAQHFDVWSADSALHPGENWRAEMAHALDRSNAMVVLLTPDSVESEWVRRDIDYALSTERFQNRLIPVVLGPRAPWLEKAPWVLKKLQVVESPTAAQATERVAEVLRKAR